MATKKIDNKYSGIIYAGLTAFRQGLKEYIDEVERGGRIVLLRGDQLVAIVLSIKDAEKLGLMPTFVQPDDERLLALFSQARASGTDPTELVNAVKATLASLRETVDGPPTDSK